jgi:hypothetical protein
VPGTLIKRFIPEIVVHQVHISYRPVNRRADYPIEMGKAVSNPPGAAILRFFFSSVVRISLVGVFDRVSDNKEMMSSVPLCYCKVSNLHRDSNAPIPVSACRAG